MVISKIDVSNEINDVYFLYNLLNLVNSIKEIINFKKNLVFIKV